MLNMCVCHCTLGLKHVTVCQETVANRVSTGLHCRRKDPYLSGLHAFIQEVD